MIAAFDLRPLPGEGGFFRETHRSKLDVDHPDLGRRPSSTAIYYLLTSETYSALHRLKQDEVYHFYDGDPVELVEFDEAAARLTTVRLGSPGLTGHQCQHVVAAGRWQGSRLVAGGSWALMGTTVSPAFSFADCQLASPALLDAFPQHRDRLSRLLPAK